MISILVPAVLLTVVLEVLRRRHPFQAVAAALVIIVGLFAVDVLSGARLQLNTLFGYSTAVAGRFAGLGNLAFGFLAAATLLLAVTAFEGIPGRRGLHVAIAILVAGVLLDGLPMLGGDVGGVLAMVPAFGLTAMVLAGRRVRPRHVVAWCAAGAATVLAFGLIDLVRPRDERTHLARFLERVQRPRRRRDLPAARTAVGRELRRPEDRGPACSSRSRARSSSSTCSGGCRRVAARVRRAAQDARRSWASCCLRSSDCSPTTRASRCPA